MLGLTLSQFVTACSEAEHRRRWQTMKTLRLRDARELETMAACIVPTTDTPGAKEAGVIYFMDTVLGSSRADMLESIRAGLADLEARARFARSDAHFLSDLNESEQIQLLTEIQDTDFFQDVRLLTLGGLLAHPDYGGNRDRIGWKLIGFEDQFSWQPPFGYYDEHYGTEDQS